jgi:lipopolysaccharide/colanic/teichoic acid biosynthesis glycosyltransferase
VGITPVAREETLDRSPDLRVADLVTPVRESRLEAAARRVVDIAVAVPLLLILSPVLAGLALWIRLESPGPPLFRQRRIGRGGRSFVLYKFRSMRAQADPTRHRDYVVALIRDGAGEAQADAASQEGLYKLVVDPRVTRAGRILRRWSLDELPQLINVVRGDMSIVGPRPVIPYEVEQYPDWYMERFAVKPGMTGLWQVSGRNERTYEEMVRLDVEYARTRTLRLDLTIMLKTVKVVLSRQGAA